MPTLWIKPPDEALFYADFDAVARKNLEGVFSSENPGSPFMQALAAIGLSLYGGDQPVLQWYRGKPYFNGTLMMKLVTGGAVVPEPSADGGYKQVFKFSWRHLIRLLGAQWKLMRYVAQPDEARDPLVQSIALGFVLQGLVFRLGQDAAKLASWISGAAPIPAQLKSIVAQIQSVQVRRTALSPVWQRLFPHKGNADAELETVEWFWDRPPADDARHPQQVENILPLQRQWQGMPASAGHVMGVLVVVLDLHDMPNLAALRAKWNAPLVLLFRRARPETVAFFTQADAALFAGGGVLSHACTVAREMNLPSVTALGDAFFEYFAGMSSNHVWLEVDATAGTVRLVER